MFLNEPTGINNQGTIVGERAASKSQKSRRGTLNVSDSLVFSKNSVL